MYGVSRGAATRYELSKVPPSVTPAFSVSRLFLVRELVQGGGEGEAELAVTGAEDLQIQSVL